MAFGLAIALPMVPATASFFEFKSPSLSDLGLVVAIALLYLTVTELVKIPLVRFLNRKGG